MRAADSAAVALLAPPLPYIAISGNQAGLFLLQATARGGSLPRW